MKNKKEKETKNGEIEGKEGNNNWLPIGMCLGISMGTVIGAASNNFDLWLPIGLCVGVSLGAAFFNKGDKNDKK